MTLTVIGLCGLVGSGKTTIAEMLVSRHSYVRVAFAGHLKAMSAIILDQDEMAGHLKEESLPKLGGKTPRQFMQLLGTEFGRHHFGDDFWVNLWKEEVSSCWSDLVVCDDVRFANEAKAIRELGGTVIKLVRDGAGSATGSCHASEQLDFRVDLTLHNNGSAEQLADDIAWIAREPYQAEAA